MLKPLFYPTFSRKVYPMWKNTKTGEHVGRILSHEDHHVMVENGLYPEHEFFATHEEVAAEDAPDIAALVADLADNAAAIIDAGTGEQSEPASADA